MAGPEDREIISQTENRNKNSGLGVGMADCLRVGMDYAYTIIIKSILTTARRPKMMLFDSPEYQAAIEKVILHLLPSDKEVGETDVRHLKKLYRKITGMSLSDGQFREKLNGILAKYGNIDKLEGYAYFQCVIQE